MNEGQKSPEPCNQGLYQHNAWVVFTAMFMRNLRHKHTSLCVNLLLGNIAHFVVLVCNEGAGLMNVIEKFTD